MLLSQFVILRATSLDHVWTSRPVRALLAPGLCTPIIFGIHFLSHNHIVTDHAARSCIDKKNGYNLLHPETVLPPQPSHPPNQKRKLIHKFKKLALSEVRTVCAARHPVVDSRLDVVKDIDIAAAIRSRVATLASLDSFREEEAKIRKIYKDLFEPIPHVNDLPSDCLAEINLKDPNLRVKPGKYREAWKTLLDQHLAAAFDPHLPHMPPQLSSYQSQTLQHYLVG